MFQMCGVFAEFERSMIQERVRAGLKRAMQRGTKSGRTIGRPRVSSAVERKVKALGRKGTGKRKIAGKLGIGVGTVQRILAATASRI
jgi:DNA invertase Pin-like site-specific DNA recombinase